MTTHNYATGQNFSLFWGNYRPQCQLSITGYFSSAKLVQLRNYCKKELKCAQKVSVLYI